jgi:hypothetical protein
VKLKRAWLAVTFFIIYSNGIAQTATTLAEAHSQAPLPSLMSLAQALSLADTRHPHLLKHAAQVQLAKATLQRTEHENYCRIDDVESAQIGLGFAQRQQRIKIVKRFFGVLATDLEFAADNEAMSLAFFPFNRADERRERFGSVSELEVMEKRVDYFDELGKRNKSLRAQRSTRLKLALAMGKPYAKPDNLIEPDLSAYEREIPDYDELLEQVLLSSPPIKQNALQLVQLKSIERQLSGEKPCIFLDMSAVTDSHNSGYQDAVQSSLNLNENMAAIEHAGLLAIIAAKRAESLALDFRVREQVLEWVQNLQRLNQQIKQNAQNLEYRERALDKSRLMYEMEVSAQIGQAQADMAKLIWQDARAKFKRALIWEQIDAVLGASEVRFEQ